MSSRGSHRPEWTDCGGDVRLSVSICVIAILAGCGERKTTSPKLASPAVFATQQSPPKPPPPDELVETEVLPLDSDNCTDRDTPMIDLTSAYVTARCDSTGSTTRVLVTVMPRTTDPADYLQALSLRFCGDVIDAEGPPGWKTKIDRDKGRDSVAAYVTWELPEAVTQSNKPSPGRNIGFAVRLRGRWRRGLGYYVGFSQSGGPISGSPHDCPYPFK
jgi:hypothetical protein